MWIIKVSVNQAEIKRRLEEIKKIGQHHRRSIVFILLVFGITYFFFSLFLSIFCGVFFIFWLFNIRNNRLLLAVYVLFVISAIFLAIGKDQTAENVINYAFLFFIVFALLLIKDKLAERFFKREEYD